MLPSTAADTDLLATSLRQREMFVFHYAWAFPSIRAIDAIKDFVGNDWVLEVCSGLGLWASLLSQEGIKVFATDPAVRGFSVDTSTYLARRQAFHYTYPFSAAEAPRIFASPNVLMLSWPAYNEPHAHAALSAFRGSKLVFLGEHRGATGDDAFFALLDRNWVTVENISIPRWHGINDRLYLYQRAN